MKFATQFKKEILRGYGPDKNTLHFAISATETGLAVAANPNSGKILL